MFKKIYFPLITFIMVAGSIYISFHKQLPNYQSDITLSEKQFSTDRALVHLKNITQKPHYVGTEEHTRVRNYIVNELEKLGLKVEIQEQEVFNAKWGAACKVHNILTRIDGSNPSGKALMLLSHYDSAPNTKSLGASDAGSGVVTILESVRAFIASEKKPKNDIIILISDAEELGLLGAEAFVDFHPWAKEVGLVVNLEARGSGGPSYMLLETNEGNAKLIETYNQANVSNPVGNSLMYSIYKMLPNDTDLTVFRENADIDGFNFAFIDDHFDYHSEQDSYERLDRNTLAHQGSYTTALLNYYADADLSNLKSKTDLVFFNFPYLGTLYYPFSWVFPMSILAGILFLSLFVIGVVQNKVSVVKSFKSFIPFLLSIMASLIIGVLGWKIILYAAPQYKEILHGFTYNGHGLIIGFISLSIALFWMIYRHYFNQKNLPDLLFAPVFVWVLLNIVIAVKLKGAGFFIIPLIGMLITYAILILSNKFSDKIFLLFTLFTLLGWIIFSPLITMFPVGLGLKMMALSTFLTVLMMSTSISILDFYKNHTSLISLFLLISVLSFGSAYIQSGFSENQRKPNSIIFFQDTDANEAFWASYDGQTDDFTKQFLGENPQKGDLSIPFGSKYGTKIALYQKTNPLNFTKPDIQKTVNNTLYTDKTVIDFHIKTLRHANLFYVLAKDSITYYQMRLNGVDAYKNPDEIHHITPKNRKLVSYYLAEGMDELHLTLIVPKGQNTTLELYEISQDLTENKVFSIEPRSPIMMAKPFVINDAVVLKTDM